MATLNDLFLDDDGFLACGEPQDSKEWDALNTQLFKAWLEQKKIIAELKAEIKNLNALVDASNSRPE